jgi:S1-C subfamily serine protease
MCGLYRVIVRLGRNSLLSAHSALRSAAYVGARVALFLLVLWHNKKGAMKKKELFRGVLLGVIIASVASIAIGSEESTEPSDQPKEQSREKSHTHILPDEQLRAIVTIESQRDQGKGYGTGFIGKLKGVLFVFTNRHVIEGVKSASIKTLNGSTINYSHIFFAVDHDIAILRLANQEDSLPALTIIEESVGSALLGEEIIIPGNSQGRGVFLQTEGKVVALGPRRIEHDAPTFRGNSGSPIMLKKNFEVVGIDTDSTVSRKDDLVDLTPLKSQRSEIKSDVRYFGYRINTVDRWIRVELEEINKQKEKMREIEQGIRDVKEVLNGNIPPENDRIIRFFARLRDSITHPAGQRRSHQDIEAAHRGFSSSIRSYISILKDEAKRQQSTAYEFHRESFADLEKRAATVEQEVVRRISWNNLSGLR